MSKKIVIWLMVANFLTTVSLAQAQQQPARIPRIGILIPASASS